MRSSRTDKFKRLYDKLPVEIREKAQATFKTWRKKPYYPGLHFKCVDYEEEMWSIRITIHWRALCLKQDDTYWWFWIGSHNDYDNIV